MAVYRQLTQTERQRLRDNGCRCLNWDKVRVKDGFNADSYHRVGFSGEIFLGNTDRPATAYQGIELASGIFDANVDNCTIGDNVRISHIGNTISRYVISDGCHISNVGSLITSPGTTFGNGTAVNVLNETGGRTNIIFDRLSAQIAYMMTFDRHDTDFIRQLTEIINRYVESKRSDYGYIGQNSIIADCGTIKGVYISDEVRVEGALRLIDGSIGQRALVGPGVIAEHFITQSQSTVDNASILKNTFVGQAARLSNCFVSHDSMFFANCVMECGEAVATFAGPHTVSMHKSSLLIGGYFSFFNAGSGTNQSNHLYKLGPMHQGIMERGCKTASNAYVMWPARFGGFTLVSGSHYGHPDTSKLPYSYAISKNGKTMVVPAANLKTMGTIRDLLKWGERDKRDPGIERFDLINYDNLTPRTTNGMYNAISFLNELDNDPDLTDAYRFEVEPTAIKRGKEYYALGVEYFMGEAFVQRLLAMDFDNNSSLREQLSHNTLSVYMDWVDMAGMIAPKELVDDVRRRVVEGSIQNLKELEDALRHINDNYLDLKWAYVMESFTKTYSITFNDLTPETAISIIGRWRDAVMALDRLRKEDAMKDYSEPMFTGFGIDGDFLCQQADFKAVNGNPEEHEIIVNVHKHYTDALLDAHETVIRIRKTFAITD